MKYLKYIIALLVVSSCTSSADENKKEVPRPYYGEIDEPFFIEIDQAGVEFVEREMEKNERK